MYPELGIPSPVKSDGFFGQASPSPDQKKHVQFETPREEEEQKEERNSGKYVNEEI